MNWEEAEESLKITVKFFIQRMQKPVYLTIGKFVPANTQLFIGVSMIVGALELELHDNSQNSNVIFYRIAELQSQIIRRMYICKSVLSLNMFFT